MSGPIQIRKLKVTEYPQGISTPQDAQRLFAALNPMLEGLKGFSSGGVSVGQNLDSQLVTFQVTTPASDWTTLTLSAGTNTAGRELSSKQDAFGRTDLRGKLATVPVLSTAIATLPASQQPATIQRFAVDANGAYGAVEISAAGVLTQVVGSVAGTLDIYCSFPSVNNAAGVYSSFPIQVRTKDGRQPLGVFLLNVADSQNANPSNTPNSGSASPSILAAGLQWSYVQSGTGQSFISIDGIPGLALGRTYDVAILVVY